MSTFYKYTNFESMAQIYQDDTLTDNALDIPLNPDGTLPSVRDKALDALNNTTTFTVFNPSTRKDELLIIRHAPFGMPLSQQDGPKWWLNPDSETAAIEERAEAAVRNEIDYLRQTVELVEAEIATLDAIDDLRQAVELDEAEVAAHDAIDDLYNAIELDAAEAATHEAIDDLRHYILLRTEELETGNFALRGPTVEPEPWLVAVAAISQARADEAARNAAPNWWEVESDDGF